MIQSISKTGKYLLINSKHLYTQNWIPNIILDMSKPHSFKCEPWTAFPRDSYSIITDDFVHEKLLTVKVASKTDKGTINLKNQVVAQGDSYKSSGEIKVWFPVWQAGTLYFKSVNKEFKLHYDNGVKNVQGLDLNFYGSYQMIKQNNSSTFKAGVIYFHPKFDVDTRLRVAFQDINDAHISTGHKINWAKDKWAINYFEIWNWNGAASIARNALRVGYKHNDNTSFFLRAANNNERQFNKFEWANPEAYFSHFAFNAVHKVNETLTLATEVDFTKARLGNVVAVALKNLPEKNAWVKVRASKTGNGANVALAYQGKLGDYGKWLFGAEVAGLGDKNVPKYGVQLDLNL